MCEDIILPHTAFFTIIPPETSRYTDPGVRQAIEAALAAALPQYGFTVVSQERGNVEEFIVRPDQPADRAVIKQIAAVLAAFSSGGDLLN